MGNFGSNLGSGFYCSFQIKTTSTASASFGDVDATQLIKIFFNNTGNHQLRLQIYDNAGNILDGYNATPTINFNDGGTHTVVITANFSTQVIVMTIDGIAQTVSYNTQMALSTWINFAYAFYIGARNSTGTAQQFYACTLDNFQIGTSPTALYGNYLFNEGSGTTTADSSGQGNTGTLSKGAGAYPTWGHTRVAASGRSLAT
jgi:hypothetical protein